MSNHGNNAAIHLICDERVFPMFYHKHYKGTQRKRVAGLYYCVTCDVPTYSVKYRFIRPDEKKQKLLEEIA